METLTAADIASREHVSIDTVKRALKSGKLKGHKIGARGDWRVKTEDYEKWLSEGALTTAKEQDNG
jgi:excisionase family DNA binding protein